MCEVEPGLGATFLLGVPVVRGFALPLGEFVQLLQLTRRQLHVVVPLCRQSAGHRGIGRPCTEATGRIDDGAAKQGLGVRGRSIPHRVSGHEGTAHGGALKWVA